MDRWLPSYSRSELSAKFMEVNHVVERRRAATESAEQFLYAPGLPCETEQRGNTDAAEFVHITCIRHEAGDELSDLLPTGNLLLPGRLAFPQCAASDQVTIGRRLTRRVLRGSPLRCSLVENARHACAYGQSARRCPFGTRCR